MPSGSTAPRGRGRGAGPPRPPRHPHLAGCLGQWLGRWEGAGGFPGREEQALPPALCLGGSSDGHLGLPPVCLGGAAANEEEGQREGTRVGGRSLARSLQGCPRSLSVVSRTRSSLRLPGPTEGGAAVPGARGGPPKETPHAGRACAGRGTLPEPPPAVRPQLPAPRGDAVRPRGSHSGGPGPPCWHGPGRRRGCRVTSIAALGCSSAPSGSSSTLVVRSWAWSVLHLAMLD